MLATPSHGGQASAVAIFGPTGVGKTEVAVELARLLERRGDRAVAVSADAFQLYEGLDLLAAKPDPAELEALEHRLVSFVPVERSFSVAEFAEHAHAAIDAIAAAGATPIVVGGAGLYLRAALTRLVLKPPPRAGLREELERELALLGPGALHARLGERTAAAVHPNDRKRIVRALELERMGEAPYGSSDELWSESLRRPTVLFGLVIERDALAARIGERVERMIAAGAVQEVERALELGASRTARKAIGFEELAAHLHGEVELEEAAARIERRQLRYAKRQLTWMRKLANVRIIDRTAMSARQVAERIDSALVPSLLSQTARRATAPDLQ